MSVPVGTIVAFYGLYEHLPQNYLLCEGQVINFKEHPKLWNLLRLSNNKELLRSDPTLPYNPNTNHLGPLQIRVPDLRGEFLRGIFQLHPPEVVPKPDVLPENSSRLLGSFQDHALRHHHHDYTTCLNANSGVSDGPNGNYCNITDRQTLTTQQVKNPADPNVPIFSALETRPRNIAVTFIIRTGTDPYDNDALLVLPPDIPDDEVVLANQALKLQGCVNVMHKP